MASSHHTGQHRILDSPFPTLSTQDVFDLLCTLLPESVIWTLPHASGGFSSMLFGPIPLMILTYASKFFHKGHSLYQEMKKINACIKPDSHGLTLAPFSPDSPESSCNIRCFLSRIEKNGFQSMAKITALQYRHCSHWTSDSVAELILEFPRICRDCRIPRSSREHSPEFLWFL